MDREVLINYFYRVAKNVFLMFSGVLIFFSFMYFSDTNINPINFLGNMMMLSTYKVEAITHLDDNVSIRLSTFCKDILPLDAQVECVIYQVMPFYNYTMHNDTIRSPDQYVVEGGVCRDVAVLYNSIFIRMGWIVHYDFTVPNHVFLTITKTDDTITTRCVVDALQYHCQEYGGY